MPIKVQLEVRLHSIEAVGQDGMVRRLRIATALMRSMRQLCAVGDSKLFHLSPILTTLIPLFYGKFLCTNAAEEHRAK